MAPQMMLTVVALVSMVAYWKEALIAVGVGALALMGVGLYQVLGFLGVI